MTTRRPTPKWLDTVLLLMMVALQVTPQPWPSWLRTGVLVILAALVAFEVYRRTAGRRWQGKVVGAAAGTAFLIMAWQNNPIAVVVSVVLLVGLLIRFVVEIASHSEGTNGGVVVYLKAVFVGALTSFAAVVVWFCLFTGWGVLRMVARGDTDMMQMYPFGLPGIVAVLGFLLGAFLVLRRKPQPAATGKTPV